MFKKKIEKLISLISELKSYNVTELNQLIDLEHLDSILKHKIATDYDWTKESEDAQILFLYFLDTHIKCLKYYIKSIEKRLNR